jgi:hypothetical protein
MQKLFIPIILLTILMSCDKETGDLKYSKTIPGGCAVNEEISAKNSLTSETDGVTYTIADGNLNLLVGFNATCCGKYSASYEIKRDTIFVDLLTTQTGLCNCICYYTYNLIFVGNGNNYKYQVKIPNNQTFTGDINP